MKASNRFLFLTLLSRSFRFFLPLAALLLFAECRKEESDQNPCNVPCFTGKTWAEIEYPNDPARKKYCSVRFNPDCTYEIQYLDDCTVAETGTWTFDDSERESFYPENFPGEIIGNVALSRKDSFLIGDTYHKVQHYWEIRSCGADGLQVYEHRAIEGCCNTSGPNALHFFK